MQQIEVLEYDGAINIATGLSVTSKVWKNRTVAWSKLLQKLANPVVTNETYRQFMDAPKDVQTRIKDVGGFVGGTLLNGERSKNNIQNRRIVALDIDFSHDSFWWDFTMFYDCAAAIHSTHKSCPAKPRHRLVIPLDRGVSPEEYQAISRRIAADLNMDLFDQSTFDTNRLMFWPSVSSDMEYYFEYQDGPFLSADSILDRYLDWRDISEWPQPTGAGDNVTRLVKKQEDPETKSGIIGAFCRTYTMQDAIDTFLPDIYAPAGEDRYTYIDGTTAGGLVIYEDKFAYSHHGTDPAGGKLCNAFDLVRIHKFSHLDEGAAEGKKSLRAMEEFASRDSRVRQQIGRESLADAKADFADIPDEEEQDTSWMSKLDTNTKGDYESSANNLNLILRNDPVLKDGFKLNEFNNKRYVTRSFPWRKVDGMEPLKDVDYSGVRNYIECVYGIVSSNKVDDAIAIEFEKKRFHPVRDYIKSHSWDGTPRVDTLLVDYFGAVDNAYTRASIRKMLCAAVARVFEPGAKFDTALILVGPQGTYKSTFVKKLGGEWSSDTFMTVQGKESFEQIQGAWLVEMAELSGLKKAEMETIKHYISKREDSYRPAYARTVETFKRQCVFFGTTNDRNFLRDPTGNRRFMPVDVRPGHVTKSVADDLTDNEIAQIWAEAYMLYKAGEPLYLTGEAEMIAREEQHSHSETDERVGIIEKYLDTGFPDGWQGMDLQDRRRWLDDPLAQRGRHAKEYVCIAEIWCECLGKDRADMSRYNTREINDILRSLSDWEQVPSTRNFPIYGKQKYYRRKAEDLL